VFSSSDHCNTDTFTRLGQQQNHDLQDDRRPAGVSWFHPEPFLQPGGPFKLPCPAPKKTTFWMLGRTGQHSQSVRQTGDPVSSEGTLQSTGNTRRRGRRLRGWCPCVPTWTSAARDAIDACSRLVAPRMPVALSPSADSANHTRPGHQVSKQQIPRPGAGVGQNFAPGCPMTRLDAPDLCRWWW
jgi:hypothetical protein